MVDRIIGDPPFQNSLQRLYLEQNLGAFEIFKASAFCDPGGDDDRLERSGMWTGAVVAVAHYGAPW